jgi:hypothetical protein
VLKGSSSQKKEKGIPVLEKSDKGVCRVDESQYEEEDCSCQGNERFIPFEGTRHNAYEGKQCDQCYQQRSSQGGQMKE